MRQRPFFRDAISQGWGVIFVGTAVRMGLNFITGICDRIYCLDQGSVIAVGTPAEIQAHPAVQAAYLGSSATNQS